MELSSDQGLQTAELNPFLDFVLQHVKNTFRHRYRYEIKHNTLMIRQQIYTCGDSGIIYFHYNIYFKNTRLEIWRFVDDGNRGIDDFYNIEYADPDFESLLRKFVWH